MVRSNPRRDALLAQVAKRQRAVGQKVSRLERQGVRVRKAQLDPRRDMGAVRSMSTPELHRYLGRLDRFASRETSFVAGRHGEPIQRGLYNRLQGLQRRLNARAAAYEQSIGGIRLPVSTGAVPLTIAERQAQLSETRFPTAGGRWKTVQEVFRTPAGLASDKAVRALIKDAENRLRPDYVDRQMRVQRRILKKMLTESGDKDVWEQVKGLDNEQLHVLIDYTPFMENVGYRYSEKQVRDGRPGDTGTDDILNQAGNNLRRLAEWAPSIPKRISGTVRSADTNPTGGGYVEKTPAGPIATQPGAHRIGDAVVTGHGTVYHIGAVASEGNAAGIPAGHIFIERTGIGRWVNPRGYTNVDAAQRKRKRGQS